jgi:hypothetical protein
MRKRVFITTFMFVFLFGTMAYAHPGRTDSKGGHTCRTNCEQYGLDYGEYHYHNGGSTSGGTSTSNSSSTMSANINDKDCTDFATYDEMIAYWNSKGYSATYDPENLDGWGNGQVDDGIPCEAPNGYDLTKINNSPQQVQFKQDQQDQANGDKQGYSHGLQDGYQEVSNTGSSASGSEAYKKGYVSGYNRGYEEGKAKIDSEKSAAANEGYELGKRQDEMAIPAAYTSHPGLQGAFEEGFNKGVKERVEAKKAELTNSGYADGKNDVHNPPKDVEELYIKAYEDGYTKAQKELEEEYNKQGYEAAFTMLKYKEPALPNDKFKDWYKQGFESNKEIGKIQSAALALGKQGSELIIPAKYQKGEMIFKHYYQKGFKAYEEEKLEDRKTASSGVGAIALLWLGRRFYVARKMIK